MEKLMIKFPEDILKKKSNKGAFLVFITDIV